MDIFLLLFLRKKSCPGIKKGIEKKLDEIKKEDDHLCDLMLYICSVPGVGCITAFTILIHTNVFKSIKCPRKFACYAGVAPFPRESGMMVRRARLSRAANKKMKGLLHMCATNAIRYDVEMKSYYERKTKGEGKPKIVVINAIRRKLIDRVFSCFRNERVFERRMVCEKLTTVEPGNLKGFILKSRKV